MIIINKIIINKLLFAILLISSGVSSVFAPYTAAMRAAAIERLDEQLVKASGLEDGSKEQIAVLQEAFKVASPVGGAWFFETRSRLLGARGARALSLLKNAMSLEQAELPKKINLLREAWSLDGEMTHVNSNAVVGGGFVREAHEARKELLAAEREAVNSAQELLDNAAGCSDLDQKVSQLAQALYLAQSAGEVGITLVNPLEEALNVAKKEVSGHMSRLLEPIVSDSLNQALALARNTGVCGPLENMQITIGESIDEAHGGQCCICLEWLGRFSNDILILPCEKPQHKIHDHCYRALASAGKAGKCPLCRGHA